MKKMFVRTIGIVAAYAFMRLLMQTHQIGIAWTAIVAFVIGAICILVGYADVHACPTTIMGTLVNCSASAICAITILVMLYVKIFEGVAIRGTAFVLVLALFAIIATLVEYIAIRRRH